MSVEGLGASPLDGARCRFLVWGPRQRSVSVRLVDRDRVEPLERDDAGYHRGELADVWAGDRYRFILEDGSEVPDPASRRQPDGVDGPSAVDDPGAFAWTDGGWRGRALVDYVLYELHVGAFTPQGTFEAATEHLDELADLGVTAVELMPVASFPGERGWGYDGVFPFGVHEPYGGPEGLRRFVDASHRAGLAVVLDVVQNHLGPEGNVLDRFGPYFTDRTRTPWGAALNVDGPASDEVRRFFLENVRMWIRDFHIDALRLDAISAIVDTSPMPFLAEVSELVDGLTGELGRPVLAIAEDDRNDARVVTPRDRGGLGMHAQWTDDLHRAVYAAVAGERNGYYADFGTVEDVADVLRRGWHLDGRPSRGRGRRWGSSPDGLPRRSFVVFTQNHDQIGNRPRGERLSLLADPETQKLVAVTVALAPFVPLLFMGEEYGEIAPFPYFADLAHGALADAVRDGRRRDLIARGWPEEPLDPLAEETFLSAKLDHRLREKPPHADLLDLHRELFRLRRDVRALGDLDLELPEVTVDPATDTILMLRAGPPTAALVVLAFGTEVTEVASVPPGRWRLLLDTTDRRWDGPGGLAPAILADAPFPIGPRSAAVYVKEPSP